MRKIRVPDCIESEHGVGRPSTDVEMAVGRTHDQRTTHSKACVVVARNVFLREQFGAMKYVPITFLTAENLRTSLF